MGNFFVTQNIIIHMYTKNKNVCDKVLETIFVLYFFLLVDTIKSVYKGTAKAMGIYKAMLFQNIFCNWLLNLCMIKYFSFHHHWGLAGIWLAKTISDGLIVACYHFTIEQIDWEQFSRKVSERMNKYMRKRSNTFKVKREINNQLSHNSCDAKINGMKSKSFRQKNDDDFFSPGTLQELSFEKQDTK